MGLINRKNADKDANENAEAAGTSAAEKKKEVAVRETAGAVSEAKIEGFWLGNDAVQAVIADAVYGDFPQVIATSGTFKDSGAGVILGSEVVFKAIQAKVKLVCAPGSNDDEAKEYFATAYEGELAFDGRTIEECVEDAKSAGYDKASVKRYIDLYGMVESNNGSTDYSGEFVCFQLAPMSVIAWNQFSKRLQMKIAFGQIDLSEPASIKAIATPATTQSKKEYTTFSFSLA